MVHAVGNIFGHSSDRWLRCKLLYFYRGSSPCIPPIHTITVQLAHIHVHVYLWILNSDCWTTVYTILDFHRGASPVSLQARFLFNINTHWKGRYNIGGCRTASSDKYEQVYFLWIKIKHRVDVSACYVKMLWGFSYNYLLGKCFEVFRIIIF